MTVGKWTDAAASGGRPRSILIADTAPLKIGTNGKLAVSGARAKAELTAGSAVRRRLAVLDTSR
ncbi:MAG: hypothetical protein ACLTLW_05320 [Sutterella wadsworthensis]